MPAVDEGKDAAERVVRGDAVLEREEPAEPVEPSVPEGLDGEEAVGPGGDGAEDEGEDVRERVALAVVAAGIGDEVEVSSERGHERWSGWNRLLRYSK